MTSYETIFNAFLSKIEEDSWANDGMGRDAIAADWEGILENALPWFKFPRFSLNRTGNVYSGNDVVFGHFDADLNSQEVQIIATLMKKEWLQRTINTWENVKVMYDERDFSQANLLNNFIKLLEKTEKECYRLQKLYSRSIENADGTRSPFAFEKLAGKRNGR